ncbi:hypothetical protein [Halomonas sp. BC2]|uniref:hypothetical protein n=1 Tax=Halomonas sp. BC2 TaxID=1670449 RepID=UPI001118DB28|nr:hypothetical protein [Halomonas sp. BC2]
MSQYLVSEEKLNSVRHRFLIKSIVENELLSTNSSLLNPAKNFRFLKQVLTILYKYNDEPGAASLGGRLNAYMSTSMKNMMIHHPSDARPRVAIMVSGMFRVNEKALLDIVKFLKVPLDADIFVHTWDVMEQWPGLGGAHTWSTRVLNSTLVPPKEIVKQKDFQRIMPGLFSAISVSKMCSLPSSAYDVLKPNKIVIENQSDFIEKLNDSFMTRGHYNQSKMFYGLKRCFELIQEYERDNSFEYDVVIRCRPDVGIKNSSLTEFSNVQDRVLYTAYSMPAGPQDQFFMQIGKLWKKLSLFGIARWKQIGYLHSIMV